MFTAIPLILLSRQIYFRSRVLCVRHGIDRAPDIPANALSQFSIDARRVRIRARRLNEDAF